MLQWEELHRNIVALFVLISDSKASTLIPSSTYFACENSNEYATFNCSGNGLYINWLVDGLSIHDTRIEQRNIAATDGQVVCGYVSSALMIQTTTENNNTIVTCHIIQLSFAVESLPSVMLILQGKRAHNHRVIAYTTTSKSFCRLLLLSVLFPHLGVCFYFYPLFCRKTEFTI